MKAEEIACFVRITSISPSEVISSALGRESRGGALSLSHRCPAAGPAAEGWTATHIVVSPPSCSQPHPPPPLKSHAAHPIRVRETAAGGEHAHDVPPLSK